MKDKSLLNFIVGLLLGSVSIIFYEYNVFLYFTVWFVQTVIIYILINMELK